MQCNIDFDFQEALLYKNKYSSKLVHNIMNILIAPTNVFIYICQGC